MEAIALRLEAIASRFGAIAIRWMSSLLGGGHLGWRPSLAGWRPSLVFLSLSYVGV